MSCVQISLEEEYAKPNDIKPEDIKVLREWLNTQPHLPAEYITELDLVLAYHSCDRSSEITKQVLDAHYTLKTVLSIFKERTFDHRLETVLGNHLLTLLPTRTKEGYKIFFNHFHHDPQTFSLIDNIRTTAMIIDLWQYEEGTWPGFIIICNMESVSLKHVAKFDINVLQQFFYYLQEAFFVKMKAIHVINAPSFAEMVLNSFRPILKGTLLQQVHLHPSGSDKLGQYFPVEALPKDVGGSYKTVKECKDEVIEKMRSASQFFIEENKKRVTESLRPGKPKTISDFFGSVEGTFKKLEVD